MEIEIQWILFSIFMFWLLAFVTLPLWIGPYLDFTDWLERKFKKK